MARFAEQIIRRKFKIGKRYVIGRFRRFAHALRHARKQVFFQPAPERPGAHRFRNETHAVKNGFPCGIHQLAEPLRVKFRLLPPVDCGNDRIRPAVPAALRGVIVQKIGSLATQKTQMTRQRPGKLRFGELRRKIRRGGNFAPEISHLR